MTKEDLIDLGYKPELCKIGTLYFKMPYFFCMFDWEDKNKVKFFYCSDDMHSVNDHCMTKEDVEEEENKYWAERKRVSDLLSGKTVELIKSKAVNLFEDFLKNKTYYNNREIYEFVKEFSTKLNENEN